MICSVCGQSERVRSVEVHAFRPGLDTLCMPCVQWYARVLIYLRYA